MNEYIRITKADPKPRANASGKACGHGPCFAPQRANGINQGAAGHDSERVRLLDSHSQAGNKVADSGRRVYIQADRAKFNPLRGAGKEYWNSGRITGDTSDGLPTSYQAKGKGTKVGAGYGSKHGGGGKSEEGNRASVCRKINGVRI